MDDKRRTAGNDEDIDLSGMINEYSQDNELRKKIEELKKQKEEENFTYILKCSDGTFYTGWTNDLKKRLKAHNEGKGAKYTKTRRPVALQYYEVFASREEAMRREYQIKRLPRKRKEELIENYQEYQKESQTGHEIGYQKENPA